MSNIQIANEGHWHALRLKNVGASESPALFDLLPWKTRWTLWMEKAGKLPAPELDDVKHIKQGKHFEPAIAGWAKEKWGITLNKVRRYIIADDCPGMGSSRDYEQVGTGERIATEIKWVVRRDDAWEYDGDEIIRAPEYYLIQLQHQLGCTDDRQGQLIAFIDGDLRRGIYDRRPLLIGHIKTAIRDFWQTIEDGKEPTIDFKADAEAVMRYAAMMPVRQVEWTPEIAVLAQRAHASALIAKAEEEECKAAKAELANLMIERAVKDGMNDPEAKIKTGGVVDGQQLNITNYYVGPYAGKEVTPEMVGTWLGARDGYRVCLITAPKGKKKDEKNGTEAGQAESTDVPA